MSEPGATTKAPRLRREDLISHGDFSHELPAAFRSDMRVGVRIYADESLLEAILQGDAMTQLINVATLPGVDTLVYGMPDIHEGYGFPVGGVAATRMTDGVVSPGGIGFDINCGVRLLATPLSSAELGGDRERLVHELSRSIPSGMGRGGGLALSEDDLDHVMVDGSPFVVHTKELGIDADLEMTESRGCFPGADPSKISTRARDRGRNQLGTMGSGNHFVELQRVDEIFDERAASTLGLFHGQVTALIHCGSRGLGHQICTDYLKRVDEQSPSFGIALPDRQLACAPLGSPEANDYLAAMAGAANFAWANRQVIAQRIRQTVVRMFPRIQSSEVRLVYDVAHNIAKIERYGDRELCVHRKGATRAFGPGHPELPESYREIGQPVLIPGSMGTASFVMVGAAQSMSLSWGSACHGAGRTMSRSAAKRAVTGGALRKQLEADGIVVRSPSRAGLAEEAPLAYKDVDAVVEVVEQVGLARRVARLRPIGVIKG
jgi:tRNA-splicing ligase RtcB (3'-phosphate/5'-hydroxy nucleic acid ligase)